MRQKLLSLIGRIGREARSETTTGKVVIISKQMALGGIFKFLIIHTDTSRSIYCTITPTVLGIVCKNSKSLNILKCKVYIYICCVESHHGSVSGHIHFVKDAAVILTTLCVKASSLLP